MKSIKKTIRNFLIYGFWLTGIPALRRFWLKRRGPLVRVLAYHDVPEEQSDNFRRQITYLQENYNLITPEDFRQKNFSQDQINILLTFDDGYKSWAEIVLPILKKRNLGGIFFISSGFIDTAGDEKKEREFCKDNLDISHRPPLSWKQVQQIDETSHCEIGGHTRTHPRLATIDKDQAFREIQVDKSKIENHLDHPIKYFAFPYGKRKDIMKATNLHREAGYKHGFSTEINFVSVEMIKEKPISRTMIELDMANRLLSCLASGVYDIR